MYKMIFKLVIALISQPAKTWKELVVDMEKEETESGKG